MDTGAKLKQLRIDSGLSREDVANELGITVFTVGHWETGRRKPRFDMFKRLAELYNTSTSNIMGDTESAVATTSTDMEFLDKVILEFANEGVLSKDKLFDSLDDTNRQIMIGAINKHILKLIKTATEE